MQEQAPSAKSPGAQLAQALFLGHGPPPSLHRKAKLLNTSPKSCAQSSPCKVRMLKLLSVEGTDMLVLSKSKVQERGFFALAIPLSSTHGKMLWMQNFVVCVSAPASLSLLLSSGLPPPRPAGGLFLKHKSCPHSWLLLRKPVS